MYREVVPSLLAVVAPIRRAPSDSVGFNWKIALTRIEELKYV